ncbi:hypothetical protein N301_00086, partial [Charadrius vociferus]
AAQVSGCNECLSLALVSEGVRDTACVRCDQVNDLLRQVVELREEVGRLRSIRDCESEIDWWSHTLRQRQQEEALPEVDDPLPSCHQAEGGDLRDKGEWRQVPPWRGKQNPSRPPSPSQLPLCNRYGALEIEGQMTEDGEDDPSSESPRAIHSPPHLRISSTKKERRVIVVGDSLLRGTEGTICRPGPYHREVSCLRGARIKDIQRKLPSLVHPSDYYPLQIFQVGGDEVATRSLRAMKNDFRALGQLVKGSGAQIVFSIPPVEGVDEGINRRSQQINSWLRDWCIQQNFVFFGHGLIYRKPGMQGTGGDSLTQRGRKILGQELAGFIYRALN